MLKSTKQGRPKGSKDGDHNNQVHSKGYIMIWKPDHPNCNSRGLVPEHRLVIELLIERYIDTKKEDVHHIDGNVKNNSLGNLLLVTKSAHRKIHGNWRINNGRWEKLCKRCNQYLPQTDYTVRKSGRAEGKEVTYCRKCSSKKY